MTRRTAAPRRPPHVFVAAEHPDPRGRPVCGHHDCGLLATAAVHDMPDNPAAAEDARRLGERTEREDT